MLTQVHLLPITANTHQHAPKAGLTSAIGALLSPYLEYGKVVTIGSGFAANNVSPNWALGDSSKDPSNLFLIVEVG